MLERNKPPFRADHVGSFIRPDDLIEALRKYDAKELPEAEFRAIQQRAIRDIVKLQEDLGFRVCTDGEFNRRGWHRDFLLKIQNVALVPSKVATRFHTATGEQRHAMPTMAVQGKLGRPSEMFVGDFRYLKSIAHTTPKLTIPSPTILHFRGGRETIDATAFTRISPASTARRSPIWPPPAAPICRSTTRISPISATRNYAPTHAPSARIRTSCRAPMRA